ncbi:MAG: RraA family protein [Anaerolineae bacterium]|nr:RraA family protein [Anaerolineales bacterium]MCQ3972795.1 RraA family protein [Anaerolineae bacterium]
MEWQNEQELMALIRAELFTAVIGDILDNHGYTNQFLPPELQPLAPDMLLVGRAMPVLEANVFDSKDPYGLLFAALDDLKRGEIYVASGASARYAMWGELMSTAARARGATGALLNGYVRDTKGILEMRFPVFCLGRFAQDQKGRGRVIDYRVAVEIGGVRIQPGDMLIGDIDGVVVVPQQIETEIFSEALEKARAEKVIKLELEQGMLATDAFKKYGIL